MGNLVTISIKKLWNATEGTEKQKENAAEFRLWVFYYALFAVKIWEYFCIYLPRKRNKASTLLGGIKYKFNLQPEIWISSKSEKPVKKKIHVVLGCFFLSHHREAKTFPYI